MFKAKESSQAPRLYGRTVLLRKLAFWLKSRSEYNLSLVGIERSGKSSLLDALANLPTSGLADELGLSDRELEQVRFVKVNLLKLDAQDPKGLWRLMGTALAAQMAAGVPPECDSYQALAHLIGSAVSETRVIFLMDEFERVALERPMDETYGLRALCEDFPGYVHFVTATRHDLSYLYPEMRKALVNEKDPNFLLEARKERTGSKFYLSFEPTMFVGPLESSTPPGKQDVRALLVERSQHDAVPLTEEELSWVEQVSGGFPHLVQGAYYRLAAAKADPERVNEADLLQEVERQLLEDFVPYCEAIYNDLTPEEQAALNWVYASANTPPENLPRHTRFLKGIGLIKEVRGGQYQICPPIVADIFRQLWRSEPTQAQVIPARQNSAATTAAMPEKLTPLQEAIYKYLQNNPGRVVPGAELCQHLYHNAPSTHPEALYNQIRELRAKMKEAGSPERIETVPRAGYRFFVSEGTAP